VYKDDVRIGTTEAIFRNVNERIAETAERFVADSAEFVCECADQACTDRVEAPLTKYAEVRKEATQFLLAPGHEHERVEHVIERKPRYTVVNKVQRTVAATVRRLDPREAT
jgi:transcription initiation factor TFIID subunit TAF12